MAFTKTLNEFVARVEFLADIRGQVTADAAARHPLDDVRAMASDDYRAMRVKMVRLGFTEFLVATSPAGLSVAAQATGEHFSVQTSPAGAISVRGVDVLMRGEWVSLSRISWNQRRNSEVRARGDGRPRYWCEISAGSVATTVLTAGTIGIFPLPTVADQHRIWYLPEFAAITDGTHLFLYTEESQYDWHVSLTAWKIAAIRDNDAKKRADALLTMRAAAQEDLEELVRKRQEDGPVTFTRDDNFHG